MATRKRSKPQTIYQIKITLKGCRPPIWRRVWVPSKHTLEQLHWIIQISMGWTNSHLHSFTIAGLEYGVPMPELDFDDLEIINEQPVVLSKIVPDEKFKFSYLYDFGDSWDHELLVEKFLEADPETHYPRCIKAKGACPPEDCGGVWGYQEFLNTVQDPDHPEYEEMLEWIGGSVDPDAVDLEQINRHLKRGLKRSDYDLCL